MIFIGLGSNLPSAHGGSCATIEAAMAALEHNAIKIAARSRLWKTAPVPISDQNWYINAVIRVETSLAPGMLLARLHDIEAQFGRVRMIKNESRPLDLDLLDYDGVVSDNEAPHLPHPRLHERGFVLLPLQDLSSDWTHPVTKTPIDELIAKLPPEQIAEPIS